MAFLLSPLGGVVFLPVLLAILAALAAEPVAGGLSMLNVPGLGYIVLNYQANLLGAVLALSAIMAAGFMTLLWRVSRPMKLFVMGMLCSLVWFGLPVLASQPEVQEAIAMVRQYWSQLQNGTNPEIIAAMTQASTQMFGGITRRFDRPVDLGNLFADEECRRMVQSLWQLKAHWKHWGNMAAFLPFFTLGAASYLEDEEYHESAAAINPLMQETFGWIYPRLLGALEEAIGEKAQYHTDSPSATPAFPGFHIFLGNVIWQLPVAQVHYDGQYQNVKTLPADTDFTNPLSFTVSVQLPMEGQSGLRVYAEKFNPEELPEGVNVTTITTRRGSFEKALHPYAVGSGVIHSGHMVHQIANTSFAASDARITIQGHGAYSPSAGAWLIYW